MASIIAMRPLPAWLLFTLGLSVPVCMLELAANETARSWTKTAREFLVTERARSAAEITAAFEQADDAGKDVLKAIPAAAPEGEALSRLAATGQPFAVGFVFNVQTNQISEAPPGFGAARETELKELLATSALRRVAKSEFGLEQSSDMLSFNLPSGAYVTAHQVRPDLTVGWLVDDASIKRGVAPHLPNNFFIEVAPIEAEAHIDRGLHVSVQINGEKPDESDEGAADGGPESAERERIRSARKAAKSVTSESLTHFTLAQFPTTYRVAIKPAEQASMNNVLDKFNEGTFGMVSACLLGLVLFSASLFWRARGAQQLADLRTDFVAAVSHELRTPLASVRMFAELLEAGEVAEDERPEVEQALAGETRRLHATLDRMLRFGALSRGKLAPQKSKQKLAPILQEAVARAANAKVDVDPELDANVDGGLVGLALDNLLSNAKKYAPEGGPYVVRARGEKRRIFIDVVDKGPGLGWRARRLIWKPFERADARLSKATEGTGVGLALVRGIAEAHGGKATVVSKPGQGATFTLRLPRA